MLCKKKIKTEKEIVLRLYKVVTTMMTSKNSSNRAKEKKKLKPNKYRVEKSIYIMRNNYHFSLCVVVCMCVCLCPCVCVKRCEYVHCFRSL